MFRPSRRLAAWSLAGLALARTGTAANTHVEDFSTTAYRDAANTHWRGEESPATGKDLVMRANGGSYPAGGVHGNQYESGDNVEGAYSGIWFGIDAAGGVFPFRDNFRVMVDDDPDMLALLLADIGRRAVFGACPL